MVRRMTRTTYLFALFLAICGASQATANPDEAVLDASLLPGWSTDRGTHLTAFSLTLAPGWKTYWRNPGEAGIPPSFDWSGSQNLHSVALHWPTPEVFSTSGMQSIGYHDGMLLPMEVTAVDPSQPVILRARIDLGVCHNICVPAHLTVVATLTSPGANNPAIKAALRDQPLRGPDAGVGLVSCAVEPTDHGLLLTARITVAAVGPVETVVIEPGLADVWTSDTTVTRSGNTLTAAAEVIGSPDAPLGLDRSAIVLTVLGANKAVEISGCPAE